LYAYVMQLWKTGPNARTSPETCLIDSIQSRNITVWFCSVSQFIMPHTQGRQHILTWNYQYCSIL